jgi:GntR family transcriptional regulator
MQLANSLLGQIQDGTFSAGNPMPSERELCEKYGISRTTVRQALGELLQQGYVNSIQGKGTFVARSQIRQEICSIYSFDEDMRRLGKTPETLVVDFIEMAAAGALAKNMGLREGAAVYRVMRLRLADGEPMLLETNFLPVARFPGVTRQHLDNQSLYRFLIAQHHLEITHAEETFETTLLRPMEVQLFDAERGALGMLIERIAYEGEAAVEFSKSVSPAHKFKHRVLLRR